MTWPSPPGDKSQPDPSPDAVPESPWRPTPDPGQDVSSAEVPPSQSGPSPSAGSTPPEGRPRRRRGRVVPVTVGSVGVLALLGAGWIAMDRGLLPGTGGSPADADTRLADVTEEPSEAWTYGYLPRAGEAAFHSSTVDGDAAFVLTSEGSPSEDQTWSLQRVDLEEGAQEWSIDLDDTGALSDVSAGASILGVLDGHLYVSTLSQDPETYDVSRAYQVLDAGTGEVLESYDEDLEWTVRGPGLYQVDEDELSRLDPEDPTGPPLWTVVSDGPAYNHSHADGFLSIAADTTLWVDAETGEEPGWFTDDSPDLSYQVVGEQVYRTESGSRGSYLERLADDGEVLWSADADAFRISQASGTPVVLAMESGEPDGSAYEYLQRLDPRNGEEMWDEGLEEDFDWVSWVVGDVLVLYNYDSDRAEIHSLDDGERTSRLRGTITNAGSRVLYSVDDGRLSAVDLEGEQLWSVRLRGATDLLHAPGYLITHDSTAGRLTRWE